MRQTSFRHLERGVHPCPSPLPKNVGWSKITASPKDMESRVSLVSGFPCPSHRHVEKKIGHVDHPTTLLRICLATAVPTIDHTDHPSPS